MSEPIKTLIAAKRAGYVADKPYLYGGTLIELKGRRLRLGGCVAESITEWRRRGYTVADGTAPHTRRSLQVGPSSKSCHFAVYRWDQVTIAHDDASFESRRVALDAALEGSFEKADAVLSAYGYNTAPEERRKRHREANEKAAERKWERDKALLEASGLRV